jgi:hypothetical protein
MFPAFSQHALFAKVHELFASKIAWLPLIRTAVEWLAAGVFVEVVSARRAAWHFGSLFLLLPMRLLIAGSGLGVTDIAGAVAGYILWMALPSAVGRRYSLAAGTMLVIQLVLGLAPYHFQRTPAHFSWIPFDSTLGSEWRAGALILVRKAFDYGAMIGLLVASGSGYRLAAFMVAVLLGSIEYAQRWLPGRTPEITDPLIAVILALVLWAIDRDYEPKAKRG